jgi:3-ketosteroid 9alpha-monooxygenase subunit B
VTAPREHYQVRVAEVIGETEEACSLVLDVPAELTQAFRYRPGQFLTLRVPRGDGGSVARCYSLSSSPHAGDRPTITVKRMDGGHASNWIADQVRAGHVLDVLPPAGTFSPASLERDFLLLAAGSGITPVISILKSALASGRGHVVLVYANRDDRRVIFGPRLRELEAAARGRLLVVHWLDSVQGPPTATGLAGLARPYAGHEAFVCGPDPFMAVARQALAALGVTGPRVHVERFLSLAENPFEAAPEAAGGVAATLEVTLDGEVSTLPWPAGTRMLDLLIDRGLDAPFSCRQGVCGACACRLTAGQVEMAHNEVLEEQDLADGFILACQAVPLTPSVAVTYS